MEGDVKVKTADEMWEEIQGLAKHETMIHDGLELARIADWNREEAAIAMLLCITKEYMRLKEDLRDAIIERDLQT